MARLDARPEARTFSVERLLALVSRGAIRNPDFQRAVHWTRKNVLELFDSIYQGFPVGSLLLAKREMPAAELSFGPLHIQAEAVPEGFLVVDGQQRIQALAGAMLHPEASPRGGSHGVWFDLEAERFFVPSRGTPPTSCVPLNVVGSSAKLGKWVVTQNLFLKEELAERAFELGARIREFQLPAYVLENADQHALRQVFQRTNVSGVRMKEVEVFEALYATSAGKPVALACFRLAEETGFGAVEESELLKCMKMLGGDVKESIESLDIEDGATQLARVSATSAALAKAIRLLTVDAQIPHLELLPYTLPLPVLSRFFHFHPEPSQRARTLLVRWVWRGALSGVHSNNNQAILGRLLKLGQGSSEAWALALLRSIDGAADPPSPREVWRPNSARLKACLVALCAVPSRVRVSSSQDGLVQDFHASLLARLGEDQLAAVFPDAFARDHGTVARAIAGSKEDLENMRAATPEALALHGIDEAARRAWLENDAEGFEAARSRTLDGHFAGFFAEMVGPPDDDRVSVAELVRQADGSPAAP